MTQSTRQTHRNMKFRSHAYIYIFRQEVRSNTEVVQGLVEMLQRGATRYNLFYLSEGRLHEDFMTVAKHLLGAGDGYPREPQAVQANIAKAGCLYNVFDNHHKKAFMD